jgi:hypothetical protein
MRRLLEALLVVLLVCLGVRLAAWLIEPALPMLGTLVVLVAVGAWLFGRFRGGGAT